MATWTPILQSGTGWLLEYDVERGRYPVVLPEAYLEQFHLEVGF